MSYESQLSQLGALEAFDPAAFVGDDKTPQAVCDFILALALVYNDFHDIFFARYLLRSVAPKDIHAPSVSAALNGGLLIALIRTQTGVIHELLSLVEDNEKVLDHASFRTLLTRLPKTAREAWHEVTEAAAGATSAAPMARALMFYRNKVAFHYDVKEIRRGYHLRFGPQSTNAPIPLLSRGESIPKRRFYFADAAAEAYLVSHGADPEVDEFLRGGGQFLEAINASLYELVTKFINGRGFGWRALSA